MHTIQLFTALLLNFIHTFVEFLTFLHPPITGFEAVTCEFTDENCEYRYYVAVDDEGQLQTVFVDENSGT